jgi:hypothetical protein
MEVRIMITAIAIFAIATMAMQSALATTQIETHLSCTGDCSWSGTVNNKTISISSNESLEINSSHNASENEINTTLAINATGAGKANITGTVIAENISVIADSQKIESKTGMFGWVFNFLRSFSFLGWFGEKI